MNFLDLALKRKSCRAYSSKPVSREIINRCLEAARLSPSACNSQPWHFIVVDNPEIKDRLAKQAFSGVYSMNSFAAQAPILVVIIREGSRYAAQLAGSLRGIQYSLIDLGIVGEHFVLQAAEEGLGTCWIGWFNTKAVKKLLGITRSHQVDIIISLGYPQDKSKFEKKRKTLGDISEFR